MQPVVKSTCGAVRGALHDGVTAFLGIPYAASPFGAKRLLAPAPVEPWHGVRDALAYGPTAPQTQYRRPFDGLLPNPIRPGDDCLNLNVWTPDAGASGLPVMVWVHGGSFANGSGAVPEYEGSRFARDGVVCVTLNYRLGVEGFAQLAGAPANRGLLDQVAALRWVHDNVARFGGDPTNVTIFGESAGGMSVTCLLAMPRAEGLFRRAIAQSGAGHHVSSPATAERVAAILGRRLGVPPTRDAVAALPPDQVLKAQSMVAEEALLDREPERWGDVAANGMPWEPVTDGDVLPGRPIDLVAGGAGARVDLMTGTTTEEHRFFLVPPGVLDMAGEAMLSATAAGLGLPQRAVDRYRSTRPGASAGDLLSAVITDWFFRVPAVRLAEAHTANCGRTHLYEFAWRTPVLEGRLGACHSLELPFVFDTLAAEGVSLRAGPEPPQSLASAMHGAWVAFARSGDPGWPCYDLERRTTMRFGDRCEVLADPGSDERRLWDGIR